MTDNDWEIPRELQPDPDDYRFDVDTALRSVVGVKAIVPQTAFTAGTLGTEREGSGTVIAGGALVLTIGYLITEAETIWLISADGRALPGDVLGIDQESGLGLVQPLGRLDLPALAFGDSDGLAPGATAIFASAGGRPHAVEAKVAGRQEFAGYWEYLLDDAIFTAPAHPFWGGGALIGGDGRLLGVGSLILRHGDVPGRRGDMNMVVPIAHLPPVLDDLRTHGRVNRPARPWLGLYAAETGETVVVRGLADGGPAQKAGLQTGDRIVAVDDEEVGDLAALWRRIWSAGSAGATVRLLVQRDSGRVKLVVPSGDRASYLRSPRLH